MKRTLALAFALTLLVSLHLQVRRISPALAFSAASVVSAGDGISCAVTGGGAAKCWGWNVFGGVGDGTTIDRHTPVQVSGLEHDVSSVSAGSFGACALTVQGSVRCWGYNADGALGNGSTVDSYVPVPVSGLTGGVTAIAAGSGNVCALTSGGGVECWGNNFYGQLGDGTTTQSNVPVQVAGITSGATAVAADASHTCAIVNGGAKCWGANYNGELGDGTNTESDVPVDVVGLSKGVVSISAGDGLTCAVKVTGAAKCWGSNYWGELGNGTLDFSNVPVTVVGLSRSAAAVSVGGQYSACAVTTTGGAKCWGLNQLGTLGNGGTDGQSLVPVDVVGLSSGVASISVGGFQACARLSSGSMTCWGGNYSGELGDGSTMDRYVPVPVVGLTVGALRPRISKLSRPHAGAGTTIGIQGRHFIGVTDVSFNGVFSPDFSFTRTRIRAIVPGGDSTGKVTVTTAGGIGTSKHTFIVWQG